MKSFSTLMIPLIVLVIVIYGYKKKTNIYESFLDGAKEGLITTLNIFPAIMAMIFAVNIFLKSGFMVFAFSFAQDILNNFNLPLSILPMAILRSISGNATLAILNDIFASFGPDSYAGLLASVIQGCSDTTIYVVALYYGSLQIKKTRYTVPVALFADLIGIIAAFIVTAIFF